MDYGMSIYATAGYPDSPRGADYLARCLEMPGAKLVRADERIEVRRALFYHWTFIDVLCVKDIVVAVWHHATCLKGGSCSRFCRNSGVDVRYESNGVSNRVFFDVEREDLIPELITRLQREVEHGTDSVIFPEKMLRALAQEVSLQLEEDPGDPSVALPASPSDFVGGTPAGKTPGNTARPTGRAPMSNADTTTKPKTKKAKKAKEPKNPFLEVTLLERLGIDEATLTEEERAQLHTVDLKRIEELTSAVTAVTTGMKDSVRVTASKAADGAQAAASRVFNGIRNTVGTPPVVHEYTDEKIWITRDEAAQLIAALSGALADTDFDDNIELGEILDDVAGNEELSAA